MQFIYRNSNWSFLKKISYINQNFGCSIYPKIFLEEHLNHVLSNFHCPKRFCAIRQFYTSAHELQTRTTDKTFYMVPDIDNMRRGNIERENSDLLLLVRYNVSFCLLSIQKHKIRLKKGLFCTKNWNGKKTVLLKEEISSFTEKIEPKLFYEVL